MKINARLHSIYEGTINEYKIPWITWVNNDECKLHIFTDFKIKEVIAYGSEYKKIAIMIEPRSMKQIDEMYEFIERNYHMFDYIYTHDSILLNKCPNAKIMYWGGVWCWSDEPKTKGISMISSNKEYCDLHIVRKDLIKQLETTGLVDCFGTYNGEYATTYDTHAEYKFAVVMENYIDDYWFTEKICNCFANKVVPIYYGARRIGDFFNTDGIITVNNIKDIPAIVDEISKHIDIEYSSRLDAINDNYERVKYFQDCWKLLYIMHHRDFEYKEI